ncbi:hypothetical protein ACRALDRAFT_211582 [Sodiomyces alcalophilus JCM 7366]|uniref:uncharacterized protein n=1 Tax=Sodiomyces alcalophilus JCM 7366 TaxID=591952 RepID=UPI0039B66F89
MGFDEAYPGPGPRRSSPAVQSRLRGVRYEAEIGMNPGHHEIFGLVIGLGATRLWVLQLRELKECEKLIIACLLPLWNGENRHATAGYYLEGVPGVTQYPSKMLAWHLCKFCSAKPSSYVRSIKLIRRQTPMMIYPEHTGPLVIHAPKRHSLNIGLINTGSLLTETF